MTKIYTFDELKKDLQKHKKDNLIRMIYEQQIAYQRLVRVYKMLRLVLNYETDISELIEFDAVDLPEINKHEKKEFEFGVYG